MAKCGRSTVLGNIKFMLNNHEKFHGKERYSCWDLNDALD